MTQDNADISQKYVDALQTVANLQTACNEMELMNRELMTRAVRAACERDNALRSAKMLEAQVEEFKNALMSAAAANKPAMDEVNTPTPKRKTTSSVNH